MKTLKQKYHIKAPVNRVWQALVDQKQIIGWGAGPAKMEDKVGAHFSLWGGDIHGTNKVVIPRKKLVQEWFGGEWDKPSIATFTLQVENKGTRIDFLHEDIPDSEAKDIEVGWEEYYFGPLKDYVEGRQN